jgi:hypothetical protein
VGEPFGGLESPGVWYETVNHEARQNGAFSFDGELRFSGKGRDL